MTLNMVFLVLATTRGANVLPFIGNYSQPASSNITHMWNDIFIFTVCLFIADNKPREEGVRMSAECVMCSMRQTERALIIQRSNHKNKDGKTKLFWKFPEEKGMLASLPKCCLKMLFEGNEACLWHTEARSRATAKQLVLIWGSFLLTYHFSKARVVHF